jgi:hypothetical protein
MNNASTIACASLEPPAQQLMFAVSWRKRIIPVAIAVSNGSVWPMYHNIRLLIDCDLASCINSSTLCRVNARKSLVAFTSNTPFVVHWYDMLILSHDECPFVKIVLLHDF